MYSFYINGEDVKKFMNLFLKDDKFDKFEVRSCDITTFVEYSIDCLLNKSWFDEAPQRDYCLWSELRPYIFGLIKGKKKPKSMKFVMALSHKAAAKIHPNALACFINITFEEDKITVITGTAQKEFSLDKSLELNWGDRIRNFFDNMNIVQHIDLEG